MGLDACSPADTHARTHTHTHTLSLSLSLSLSVTLVSEKGLGQPLAPIERGIVMREHVLPDGALSVCLAQNDACLSVSP
jgi:hypothetical protein